MTLAQAAVLAVAHDDGLLEGLDVNIADLRRDRVVDDLVDELDDRRSLVRGLGHVELAGLVPLLTVTGHFDVLVVEAADHLVDLRLGSLVRLLQEVLELTLERDDRT